jgi:hypothetical protein
MASAPEGEKTIWAWAGSPVATGVVLDRGKSNEKRLPFWSSISPTLLAVEAAPEAYMPLATIDWPTCAEPLTPRIGLRVPSLEDHMYPRIAPPGTPGAGFELAEGSVERLVPHPVINAHSSAATPPYSDPGVEARRSLFKDFLNGTMATVKAGVYRGVRRKRGESLPECQRLGHLGIPHA